MSGWRTRLARYLPIAARRPTGEPTVADGWEDYARAHRDAAGLGDEWNDPPKMGMTGVAPGEVVATLDRLVFAPFLGRCECLVEIGPGGGRFTEVLLPRCRRLVAVDTSPTMLALLARRFPNDPRLECRLSDGRGLPGVEDGCADAVFSYGVFVHLQHWDIYNYLIEARRVLKPAGRAVLQHAHTFSDLGWAKFTKDVPGQLNRHKLPGSFTVMTPALMAELAGRAGFEVVAQDVTTVPRDCITLLRKP